MSTMKEDPLESTKTAQTMSVTKSQYNDGTYNDDPLASPVVAGVAVPVGTADYDGEFVVPGGEWRAGLCDCFSACACPCLMGWCCFPILLGQLVERLRFNIFGCPLDKAQKSPPVCRIFAVLFVIMLGIEIAVQVVARLNFYGCYEDSANSSSSGDDFFTAFNDPAFDSCVFSLGNAPIYYQILVWFLVVFGWFIFIVSCCTRMNMRKQYNINPLCCGDNCCDDCCTTYFCNCCSTIQMIRQTHDENEYPYEMTSRTGLGPNAPEIV